MKLKTYNVTNSKSVNTGEVTLRISKKSGLLAFSREATRLFSFKDGDRIEILNDEDNPEDWYLCLSNPDAGFPLVNKNGVAKFNCSHVANQLLASLNINRAAGFKIAKEPIVLDGMNYYAILTTNPLGVK